jgi:two-component system, OmpR family, sensor histidine kinase SenX3
MRVTGRGKTIAFFIVLGACLVSLALALNIGWIVLNAREVAMLVFGIIFFVAIIAGLVLNTTFLVREIKRNEQHDAFINAVTHELKTPIASIRLYLETLKTRNVDEARRREFYDIMLADSERLLQTIEQVLRAGQLGVKKSRDQRVILDFGKLVADCAELTRTRHHLDPDVLKLKIATDESVSANVIGDPDELQTAVLNLMDNAIKYSDKEKRVDVRVEIPSIQNVSLQITDHGIGIPREQLKRIFKRFYRAPGKLVGRIKGTGLGLFIVSSIVKKHGGRVFAESEGEGSGSTFTILLPRVKES